jgi:hypothetical protein
MAKLRIAGSIRFMNDWTGKLRTKKVPPFTVDFDTPWVEIVDQAEERTDPKWPGTWILEDDSGITDEVILERGETLESLTDHDSQSVGPPAPYPTHIVFKHEGHDDEGRAIGPVFVKMSDGEMVNYKDGEPKWEGEFFAEWYDLKTAREAIVADLKAQGYPVAFEEF